MNKKMMLALSLLIGSGANMQASVETDKALGFLGTLVSSVVTTSAALYAIKGVAKDKDTGSRIGKMVFAAAAVAGGAFLGRVIMGSTLGDNAKIYGSVIDGAFGLMVAALWNYANTDAASQLESPLAATTCTTAIKAIVAVMMSANIGR